MKRQPIQIRIIGTDGREIRPGATVVLEPAALAALLKRGAK